MAHPPGHPRSHGRAATGTFHCDSPWPRHLRLERSPGAAAIHDTVAISKLTAPSWSSPAARGARENGPIARNYTAKMLATSLPLGLKIIIIFIAGCAAGISNGIAGGGTFLSFPTLLALGVPSITANMSSSVGILPSTFGGVRGFREELTTHRQLFKELVPICALGSISGTILLLIGSNHTFSLAVPWLIGFATILFAISPRVTKMLAKMDRSHDPTAVRRRPLFIGIFVASIYGGYFGAGLGIVLLAVMALTLPYDINVLQGLRVAFSLLINAIADVVFIIRWHLDLQAVGVLLVGALIGGWLGTLLIRRLKPKSVRMLVITIGVVTTIKLAASA